MPVSTWSAAPPRQFLMATRSTVRMPRASVGSEAAGGTLAGRRSGSWTVIVEVYGEARCGRLGQASKTLRVLGARVAAAATDLDRGQMDASAKLAFHMRGDAICLRPARPVPASDRRARGYRSE